MTVLGSELLNAFYLFIRSTPRSKLCEHNTFHLLPRQKYKIEVIFHPYAVRAFQAALLINSFTVPLCGYGGNAFINCTFANRGAANSMLSFHMNYSDQLLTQIVECKNYGKLPGFIYARYLSIPLLPFSVSVDLVGYDTVLEPRHKCVVFVNFLITDEVLKYFHRNPRSVLEIGVLKLYTGAEVLRYRLSRLVDYVEESECRTLPLDLVQKLTGPFCYEQACPDDVDEMCDTPHEIDQLLRAVSVQTIPLVVRPKSVPMKRYSYTFAICS